MHRTLRISVGFAGRSRLRVSKIFLKSWYIKDGIKWIARSEDKRESTTRPPLNSRIFWFSKSCTNSITKPIGTSFRHLGPCFLRWYANPYLPPPRLRFLASIQSTISFGIQNRGFSKRISIFFKKKKNYLFFLLS